MFDRVLCVNLNRRPRRWERFQAELPTDWPFAQPQRYPAVDGFAVGLPAWFAPKILQLGGGLRLVSPVPFRLRRLRGAWGCYRTHLRILEDALTDRLDSVLVFEDDAVFAPDFGRKVQEFLTAVPDDWDQIYLGGQHVGLKKDFPEAIGDGVLRCHKVNRTHAYAIRGRMLSAAYRHLADIPDVVSEQDMHIDHRLGKLHLTGEWNIYAPRQWLVGQADGRSDVAISQNPKVTSWWNDFAIAEPEESTEPMEPALQC